MGAHYTGCDKVLGGTISYPKVGTGVWHVGQAEYWGSQYWGVEWTVAETMLHLKLALLARSAVVQWVGHCPANPKGHGFDSRSGHLPGLQARSYRKHVKGNQSMFLSLFLPCSL